MDESRGADGESAGAAPGPTVSVIVLAHDRRQFLRGAVESVVGQDLPRTSYEIIVVKGFSDPAIDAYLANIGAESIVVPPTPGAFKVVTGIRRSRGRIILILDDDDVFEPSRLRAVVDAFRRRPMLGFFSNQMTFIGPDGTPLRRHGVHDLAPRRGGMKEPLLLEEPEKDRNLSQLSRWKPDFNASSGAIRRELVDRTMPYLERLRITVDTLFFFAALCSEYSVQLDPRLLTRYRIHGDNSTRAGPGNPEARLGRLIDVARQTEADYRVIREFVARAGRPFALRLIEARMAVNHLTLASRDPQSRRRTFTGLVPELVRHLDTYPVREDFLGVLATGLFVLSPSLGRAVYQRQLGIR